MYIYIYTTRIKKIKLINLKNLNVYMLIIELYIPNISVQDFTCCAE